MSNKIWKYIYYQTRVNKIISKLSNETLENDKKTNYFAYLIPVLRIHFNIDADPDPHWKNGSGPQIRIPGYLLKI